MEEKTVEFLNQIFEVDSEIGDLLAVDYIINPDYLKVIEAIILSFDSQTFTIQVIPDDDTLEVIRGNLDIKSSQTIISASHKQPWSMSIGKCIRWSWALINQQGYPDAIQFEFFKDTTNESEKDREHFFNKSIIIQLVAISSSIKIYTLSQIMA